jgi:hypothetical protein
MTEKGGSYKIPDLDDIIETLNVQESRLQENFFGRMPIDLNFKIFTQLCGYRLIAVPDEEPLSKTNPLDPGVGSYKVA